MGQIHVNTMEYKFFTDLEELLNKCDLYDDERSFLEQLAEFMVFLEKDVIKDPRTIHERSFLKLKGKKLFGSYMKLIYDYQKKYLETKK